MSNFKLTLIIMLLFGVVTAFSVWMFPVQWPLISANATTNIQQPAIPAFVLSNTASSTVSPIPLTSPSPAQIVQTSQESPDGTTMLLMNTQPAGNLSTQYTFFVKDMTTNQQTQIYTITVDQNSSFLLPFNAWSPDDSYFFIKEKTANGTNYDAFASNGNNLGSTSQFLNVTDFFTQHYGTSYILTDVTGWASDTLLIINTNNPDNSTGPSLWFDVTNSSFTPLATRFN